MDPRWGRFRNDGIQSISNDVYIPGYETQRKYFGDL